MHDVLLANQPDGAKHNAEICPFCVEKASQSTASGTLPGSLAGPDVSENKNTEGGANPTMTDTDMISKETHEALVRQRVEDAVRQNDAALQTMTTERAEATARAEKAETELARVTQENTELNTKLDEAAVNLNTATEKAASLERQIADDTAKREVETKASERASQVKNLGLFPEDYVTEKAQKWASLSDEAWAEQVESWQKLKAPEGTPSGTPADTASAMSGTTEGLTANGTDTAAGGAGDQATTKPSRLVLGLK